MEVEAEGKEPAAAEAVTGAGASAGAGAAAGGEAAADTRVRKYPKVAFGAPYRMHTLMPGDDGEPPPCDCGRKHLVYGRTYRYCACGLSKDQVRVIFRLDESLCGAVF